MRLNAKKAKALRKAAAYKNQTLTPGVIPFPGIHHLAEFPLFETRTTIKRSSAIINGEWAIVETQHKTPIGYGKFAAKPLLRPRAAGSVHASAPDMVHATELIPVTKPVRHDTTQPKGVYRSLKKLHKAGIPLVTAGGSDHD